MQQRRISAGWGLEDAWSVHACMDARGRFWERGGR